MSPVAYLKAPSFSGVNADVGDGNFYPFPATFKTMVNIVLRLCSVSSSLHSVCSFTSFLDMLLISNNRRSRTESLCDRSDSFSVGPKLHDVWGKLTSPDFSQPMYQRIRIQYGRPSSLSPMLLYIFLFKKCSVCMFSTF